MGRNEVEQSVFRGSKMWCLLHPDCRDRTDRIVNLRDSCSHRHASPETIEILSGRKRLGAGADQIDDGVILDDM